jgi:hypothetical protein
MMTTTTRHFMIAAATAAVLAAGCAAEKPTGAMCTAPRPNLKSGRPVSPEQWFNFLVDRGLDGGTADCTGAPVKWRDPPSCLEPREPSDTLPTARFVEDDLVVSKVDAEHKLVWVVTTHYANGEGLGPVALVRESKTDLEVLATGSLRARPKRGRLKLVTLGRGTFLLAEGEACADDKDPQSCRRSATLLLEDRQHFNPIVLLRPDGSCMGPAEIDLSRRGEVSLPNGWRRKFDLNSSTSIGRDTLTVQEQVAVSDYDPGKPGVPPRPVRQADATRVIQYNRGRLVTSDASLWTRVTTAVEEGE